VTRLALFWGHYPLGALTNPNAPGKTDLTNEFHRSAGSHRSAFAFFRKEESQTLSLAKKAEMAFLFPLVLVMVRIR